MIGLIVEGTNDEKQIIMATKGRNISIAVTKGTRFTNRTKMDIDNLIRICDTVYILTDPDVSGDLIADVIKHHYPDLKRISFPPEKCEYINSRNRKYVGIEYATYQNIRDILHPFIK